ncbi:LuxR family transcriptional regulator [Jiangella aurantiaca]|uniref:LuxR family transcriptional regulator n=1 Tax=Jiangella aurantiaca TaxID=2530373 RepID=A0A4R5AHZ4_9ACTN|nr:LuxR C-terminal-related transcriptional regulator [Jiangella aurantiaca]TDD69712.1 LuxR family transcriptional regulator [Jiangella aurantiaca]
MFEGVSGRGDRCTVNRDDPSGRVPMPADRAAVRRAWTEAGRGVWPEVYRLLHDQDPASLGATGLEALADAAWWLSRVEESLAVRRRAHAAYVAAGDGRRAGYNAWMLATEYGFIGKDALAAGWLTKARRHLADLPECEEQGFLCFADAELAARAGDHEQALRLARHMAEVGARCESPDVVAMARLLEGRLRIAGGDTAAGLARLDEVMCDVMAGVLGDLVTGWLYCLAVPICFELSDMGRATAWNDAAMAWCATLPAGTPFHGLCRVHHVELLGLGGAWDEAGTEAVLACRELMNYHPNMAGESFYVAGELRRRMGDLPGAEKAFLTAHELGRDPQPGLALLRLAQGKAQAAATALAACLASGDWGLLSRARLLAAQAEVSVAIGDVETGHDAARHLEAMAGASGSRLLEALALQASGTVAVAGDDIADALARLRRARTLWLDLQLPYEAAQARLVLATAYRAAGDDDTAELELRAARSVFERLGSSAGLRRVEELLGSRRDLPAGLTTRQLDVLRLVAAGKTNRDIAAELVISANTVSRHLDNIYAKLGVSTRAAAAAFAYTNGLA